MSAAPLDAAIVGGGIAGLTVGFELRKRGLQFAILEREPRLGGVIRTEQVDGYTIDAGPDALLVQKPAALELCRELGLGDRLIPTLEPRTAYILRGGRLHPLPEASVLGIPTRVGPMVTTKLFSWPGKIRMGLEVLVPRRTRAADDESIGGFIGRRFGAEAVTYLAEPLLAGIHSGDVDRLSMRALFPRLSEAERLHGSLILAFRKLQTGGGGDGAFRSLPGGVGEMLDALVRQIPASARMTDTTALGVGRGSEGFEITTGAGLLRARHVVLATPAFVTADLVASLDAELSSLCRAIPYVSTATVALGYDRSAVTHPLAGSGFVVPRAEGLRLTAGSFVSSKWPDRAPAGKVLLRAFLGGARDPGALERSDPELQTLAQEELGRILGIRAEPDVARVFRWPRASAQHEVGHLARVRSIEARLAQHPGLHVTGSAFRGTGIADCVADGRATAQHIR